VRLAHRATLRGVNPCLRRVKLLSCSQRDPRFRRQAREPDTTAPIHNCKRTRPIGSWQIAVTARAGVTRGSVGGRLQVVPSWPRLARWLSRRNSHDLWIGVSRDLLITTL
jgi:hypothetical protein